MKIYEDAFGRAVYDYFKGRGGFESVERDDGYFDKTDGLNCYFLDYKNWPRHVKKAIRYGQGKILDIGCGAGRHALYLQDKGFDVQGIDNSPLAIKVCKQRGLKKAKVISVTQLTRQMGTYDSIVMLGNNFGLLANPKRAKWLLKRFYKMTTPGARMIVETLDPYKTSDPDHLAYQKFNRARGRMSGQIRIRVRYKKYVTSWFDYLFVSKAEMQKILEGSGWKVKCFIDSKGPVYIVIIEKA